MLTHMRCFMGAVIHMHAYVYSDWWIHCCSVRYVCVLPPVAMAMTFDLYKAVMDELPVLISENDLHISQLVLTLLCTIMDISPASIAEVRVQL